MVGVSAPLPFSMISNLDSIIFPNHCEVLEVATGRFVYPIYKNASTSLKVAAKQNQWRTLVNEQIKRTNKIEIYIRDPAQRFLSGINTFVQLELQQNPALDRDTVIHFAEQYLFLNRHYAPQFHWLINLVKYAGVDKTLVLHPLEQIHTVTVLHQLPPFTAIDTELETRLSSNTNLKNYIELDNILLGLVGTETTFKELVKFVSIEKPFLYNTLLKPIKDISNVLS